MRVAMPLEFIRPRILWSALLLQLISTTELPHFRITVLLSGYRRPVLTSFQRRPAVGTRWHGAPRLARLLSAVRPHSLPRSTHAGMAVRTYRRLRTQPFPSMP